MVNGPYDLVTQMSIKMVNQLGRRMRISSNLVWSKEDPSIVIEVSRELTEMESLVRQKPRQGDVERVVMVL
jgi:hypothetical protein